MGSGLSVSTSPGRSPSDGSPNGNGITLPHASLDMTSTISMDSPDSQIRGSTGSPEILQTSNNRGSDTLMEMLFSGWDSDLPNPDLLNH